MAGNDETLELEHIGDEENNSGTESTESSYHQRFVTRVFHEKNNQVIGAEVIIYDDDQNKIDSIVVADSTSLEEFQTKWENISKYYVLNEDADLSSDLQELVDNGDLTTLQEILTNTDDTTNINATTLNGTYNASSFASSDHEHDDKYCITNHQSSNKDYGIATSNFYGHVKIADNLNDSTFNEATALSSHQGYELNQKINTVDEKFKWSNVISVGSYIKYRVNEDLRLVVCNYNRSNYTGCKNTTGVKTLHGEGTIPSYYAPTGRVLTPLYRGDLTLYYNTDGSISLYNLTTIKKFSIHAQVMWHY
ncbi:MAG: hypothetical protein IJH63_00430 [Methanobrevibacter sp.]|nr:hypothetical protein [Methanosphaera sp.]MBR0369169.1 hypothetical protein [Methanobrevibacter sp.]